MGLTIPKLLPITGSAALPLSAYYIFLQSRVVYHRIQSEQFKEPKASDAPDDRLAAAVRAQVNFTENVPLALLLAAVVELNGGSRKALTYALSALTVFRVLHAEIGIMSKGHMGNGRPAGFFGTQGVVLGLAAYAGYLVQGYWTL